MRVEEKTWVCPRCGAHRKIEERPAHSKVDGSEICQPCGHDEWEAERFDRPQKPREDWRVSRDE